jgi:hypothetical protein
MFRKMRCVASGTVLIFGLRGSFAVIKEMLI